MGFNYTEQQVEKIEYEYSLFPNESLNNWEKFNNFTFTGTFEHLNKMELGEVQP